MTALKMTERQLLEAVRDLAKRFGWLTYHTHRSDRSEPGFPDLVLCHRERAWLVFAELKVNKRALTKAQWAWLGALQQLNRISYGMEGHKVESQLACVWLDTDWRDGTIERVLREGP